MQPDIVVLVKQTQVLFTSQANQKKGPKYVLKVNTLLWDQWLHPDKNKSTIK
jgi:hypothetical protein